jgi:hypothetical protein
MQACPLPWSSKASTGDALRNLLSRMIGVGADVVVAEVGASPPGALQRRDGHTGDRAERALHRALRLGLLRGHRGDKSLRQSPDSVTGLATSTSAGIELVEKLSGIRALDVLDRGSLPQLGAVLKDALKL